MKLQYLLETKIYEDLALVKFKYANYKNDPKPKVKMLDFTYPGQEGQKTYGKRDDLLGFNLNYFSNPRYASRAIDEIDGFARMLSANKLEKWKRLKYFYPEVVKFIRRYMRKHVNNIKHKKGMRWAPKSYNELIKINKENF